MRLQALCTGPALCSALRFWPTGSLIAASTLEVLGCQQSRSQSRNELVWTQCTIL